MSQDEVGELLLQKYYPDRNQVSIFTLENPVSEEEYLEKAYRKREKDIAYSMVGEE